MRVHFELKLSVDTFADAKKAACEEVSKFLDIPLTQVESSIDLEFKVSIPDPEKDTLVNGHFIVIAYGNVKNSIAKPF
jgi:hypothetical protein